MISRHQIEKPFYSCFRDILINSVIRRTSLEIQSKVHFGRKTGTERFKDSTDQSQWINHQINDHLIPSRSNDFLRPRLIVLHILITKWRYFHSIPQRIFNLNLLHPFQILHKHTIKSHYKGMIKRVLSS
jgi:hypothetical protein